MSQTEQLKWNNRGVMYGENPHGTHSWPRRNDWFVSETLKAMNIFTSELILERVWPERGTEFRSMCIKSRDAKNERDDGEG